MSVSDACDTRVVFGNEAHRSLLDGMDKVADAVGSTLGPAGRCVIIERQGRSPHVTKDGITVSRSLRLRDKLQSLGAELVKEAAAKTNDVAGDGTTTATVLTHALCKSVGRLVGSGHSPVDVAAGIERAACAVTAAVRECSVPITADSEWPERVARVSANGETSIGRLVADAVVRAGRDGIVSVEASKSTETTLEVVNGIRLDRGYFSPYFVTDTAKMRCVLEDPLVLVCNAVVDSLSEFIPILEAVHRQGRSLLVIAPDVIDQALQLLVVNKTQLDLKVCAVSPLGVGLDSQLNDALTDICVATGTELCDVAAGELATMKLSDLGTCRKSIADRSSTTLVIGKDVPDVAPRVESIRQRLTEPGIDSQTASGLRVRLARLAGAASLIRVGGATDFELGERRDRIDDAVNAVRAALDDGIVPGGGLCLHRAAERVRTSLSGTNAGETALLDACSMPLSRIVENAGKSPQAIIDRLSDMSHGMGYDARSARYTDMVEACIVDPTRVVCAALQNAVSVAKAFALLSAAVISE